LFGTGGFHATLGRRTAPAPALTPEASARQFRFASGTDLNMVTPLHQRGVRRAGLRLEDDRLLDPPNLMRVMPP
jgi:hypothetical protein